MTTEQKITIDDKEYTLSSLSDAARAQIVNLQVTDQEMNRLRTQLAIAETARRSYAQALQEALPKK